jgi:methionyl-tRNA synthetase
VIYVRDVLSRYDADALRFFLSIAGPENQDTDFTWAEFVRRNNDELVATWGNLVNRTLMNVYKNFGGVPQPAELKEVDTSLIAQVEAGFASIGELLDGAVNSYLSDQEPWKVIKADRERAATIWFTALRCVDSLKIFFTPFLPFSSQRLHHYLGYDGDLAGPLVFEQITEDDGRQHRVLTGNYANWVGRWEASVLPVGQELREPKPLFKKLDESIVGEELARLEHA